MSESVKPMSFEEFRAAESQPFGEAVRQQREFFRDAAAVEALLRPGAIAGGWIPWDGDAAIPAV
jgi:hypothetical protein